MSLNKKIRSIDERKKRDSDYIDSIQPPEVQGSQPQANDNAEPWPEPKELPSGLPDVPAFNSKLLPESVRDWVTDVAGRIWCPPDYPAATMMVTLASVIGRQVGIRPKRHDSWTVIPNLWGALIGRTGVLKSPAHDQAMSPINKLEVKAKEQYEQEKHEHDINARIKQAQAQAADKSLKEAIKKGQADESDIRSLSQQANQEEEDEAPTRERFVTQDATVEALTEVLQENPRGILVERDELAGFLKSFDQQGRDGSRQFFLEAWNGNKRYASDRIGRGHTEVPATCVSVIGSIQPERLQEYIQQAINGGMDDDGLAQRFQVAVWPDYDQQWEYIDQPPDRKARDKAHEVFDRLAHIDPVRIGAEADDENEVPYLRFTDAAQEVFIEWLTNLENQIRSHEEHPAIEAVLSKYRSLMPSLALISHLADNPDGGPVTEASVTRAIAWTDFLEAHARRIFAPAMDPALFAARELDRHIQKGDLGRQFKIRQIVRKNWKGLDRETAQQALEYLADLDRVYEEQVQPDPKKGGRPTSIWHVNPAIELAK